MSSTDQFFSSNNLHIIMYWNLLSCKIKYYNEIIVDWNEIWRRDLWYLLVEMVDNNFAQSQGYSDHIRWSGKISNNVCVCITNNLPKCEPFDVRERCNLLWKLCENNFIFISLNANTSNVLFTYTTQVIQLTQLINWCRAYHSYFCLHIPFFRCVIRKW